MILMNKSKTTFIKTSDIKTKEKLLNLGYELISDNNNISTFLNDVNLQFDKNEIKNAIYSNMLTF